MKVVRVQKGTYFVMIGAHRISLVDRSCYMEKPHARGALKWSLWCTTINLEDLMEGDLLWATKKEALRMLEYYLQK